MPVDHGHLQHVAVGVGRHAPIPHSQLGVERPLEVAVEHLHGLHPGGGPRRRHGERRRPQRRRQPHRAAAPVRHGVVVGEQGHAVLGDQAPADVHPRRPRVVEPVQHLQVGQPRRCDRTEHVVDAGVHGGVQRGHADGRHRVHARLHGLAHVMVDVALGHQVLDVLVVGAEADLVQAGAQRRHVGEHLGAVVVHRPRHHRDGGAQPQPVEHLGRGHRVVVVAHPAGQVGPQGLVAQARRVPGDAAASRQRRLLLHRRRHRQVERVALAQAHRVGAAHPVDHLGIGHGGAAQLQPRQPRHLGRHLLQDAQRRTGGGHQVHACGPQHVGDAVRIGEHARGPLGHHEPGQLARREHRVLQVDVAVDERRRHVRTRHVHHLGGREAAHRRHGRDVAAGDHHVAPEHLAGVHDHHGGVAQDQVGRGLATGHQAEVVQLLGRGQEGRRQGAHLVSPPAAAPGRSGPGPASRSGRRWRRAPAS